MTSSKGAEDGSNGMREERNDYMLITKPSYEHETVPVLTTTTKRFMKHDAITVSVATKLKEAKRAKINYKIITNFI